MYAYCGNSPVIYADYFGEWVILAVLGITISAKVWVATKTAAVVIGLVATAIIVTTPPSTGTVTFPTSDISISKPSFKEDDISKIAGKYDLFKCLEAAKKMLKEHKKGKIVQLYFPWAYNGYVGCDRCNDPISETKKHYGYLYDGIVYCNIYLEGLPLDQWRNSFYDVNGNTGIIIYGIR